MWVSVQERGVLVIVRAAVLYAGTCMQHLQLQRLKHWLHACSG